MHRAFRVRRRGAGSLLIAALLLVSPALRAEVPLPGGVRKGPIPAWVTPHSFDLESPVDPAHAEDGVHVLLDDTRLHLGAGGSERYHRLVRKAASQAGVEQLAEMQISFEPDYQTLTLHQVRITRDRAAADALAGASVRLLQQESDLQRRVYQGTVTAYIVLSDVRTGDVIDVSYTLRGDNPVLEGKYAGALAFETWAPARTIHAEVLSDPARAPLAWRAHDEAPDAPLPGDAGVLRWLRAGARPNREDRVPLWYRGPHIEVSEHSDWAGVVGWGLRQYSLPAPGAALREQVEQIRRSSPDRDARALQAIRFVQDEIRYLAISIGPHSHRPHPPDVVLAQRFGDCKDKAMLLVAMLRQLGLDAAPALVHTRLRGRVAGALPSVRAFDHVIVHLLADGRERWIDATRSHQGGSLWTLIEPNLGAALVLRPGSRDLSPIPERRPGHPEVDVSKEYTHEPDDSSRLTVKTRYLGDEADGWRAELARSSRGGLEQRFLNYYTKEYPTARLAAPLEVRDVRDGNEIEITERYVLAGLWASPSWDTYSDSIGGHLTTPAVVKRRLPLAAAHPVWERETQRVMIPGIRGLVDGTSRVEDAAFLYTRQVTASDMHVSIVHEYYSRSGEVAPRDLERHLARVAGAREALVFTVPSGAGRPPGNPRLWTPNYTVMWAVLGAGAFVAVIAGVWRGRFAWRRLAFRRKRFGRTGDLPSNPLRASSRAEAEARARDWKCACGRKLGGSASQAGWSELRLAGAEIQVMRLRCGGCGAESSRYVQLDAPGKGGLKRA